MAFLSNPRILVVVMLYTRIDNMKLWLKAWEHCDKYDAKLAVIHNVDDANSNCAVSTGNIAFSMGADYYIQRQNIGADMGAFQDLVYGKFDGLLDGFEWDILFWAADDTLPMKKNFLWYFLNEVMQPDVGVSGPHISDEITRHIRTNCFCIKRDVAKQLTFPKDRMENREDAYDFEHRANTLYRQVEKLGLRVMMPIEARNNTNFVTWDSGHYSHLRKFEEHLQEFPASRELGINL